MTPALPEAGLAPPPGGGGAHDLRYLSSQTRAIAEDP
jgi:hypothetical protein